LSATELVIIPTGTANLASVAAAFERQGAKPRLAEDAAQIERASHVMLPGVGSFGAAMARLEEQGFAAALQERIGRDAPTICICVGLQLLFESSEESPGIAGLGIVAGGIGRFPPAVRVPQFGWNAIAAERDCRLLEDGYAYFANSYRALAVPAAAVGWAEHGGRFVAGFERGNLLACQFHPELSGAYGAALLGRFLELRSC
jgi:imidazole glycerol-phosphate synthase subunit HisH